MFKLILLSFVILFIPLSAFSQQSVKESSTGKFFPAEIKINKDGKDLTLRLTGLAVRKKIVFKVYAIAHYMQDPPAVKDEDAAFNIILQDGRTKQITMEFSRDVEAVKIQEAYSDGFKQNSSKEEFQKIQPSLNKFTGYFNKEIKENQQIILRWISGGEVQTFIQGEEKGSINDPLFAHLLWKIWFGEDSIVDRDDLVSRMIGK